MAYDITEKEYLLDAPYFVIGDPTVANGEGMLSLGQVPSATITLTPSKSRATDVGGHPQAAGAKDRGMMAEAEVEFFDVQHALLNRILAAAQYHRRAVTSVDTSASSFSVDGDVTNKVEADDEIEVVGSTGNDGAYTVASASYNSPETTITVNESVSDTTADGDVVFVDGGIEFSTTYQPIDPRTIALIPSDAKEGAINNSEVWWIVAADDSDLGDLTWSDDEGNDANNSITATFEALLAQEDQAGTKLREGTKKIFNDAPDADLGWSLGPEFAA
jgi:hypothetical protein